jgi:uncharacterized protein (UPF0261 family)
MAKEHSIDIGEGRYLVIEWDGGWDADDEPGNHLWQADILKVLFETPEATVDITYLTELFPQMDLFIDEALRNYRTHA